MAVASLSFAPQIGLSAGVLTMTAAAGVCRTPDWNRLGNEVCRYA
jgi:hypothetical protein